MTRIIYFISGLGTTKEVFSELDLPQGEIEFLEFPEPKPGEDLKAYSARMAEPIDDNNENIIVGLSMGRIVAQEITQVKKIKKVILISSITRNQDWSKVMLWIRKFSPVEIIPARVLEEAVIKLLPLAISKNKTKIDFVKMANQFSPNYFKFAIVQLAKWTQVKCAAPIVQIHGEKVELFNAKTIEPKYLVKGGKHLMIATHAKVISNFLTKEIFSAEL